MKEIRKVMDDKFFEELKKRIQHYFGEKSCHGFDHTQRVFNNVLRISEREKADLDVVKAASLLHDVARCREDNGEIECHAEEGAKIAENILREMNFPEDKIKKVSSAIKVHRYSKGLNAETIEEKILQDADRLDALGAICVARVFSYGGKKGRELFNPEIKIKEYKHKSESNTSINHFYEKILKLKPETFKTKKARKIAKDRYKFTEDFVNRFKLEWEGKK